MSIINIFLCVSPTCFIIYIFLYVLQTCLIRGDADKSLARPGRKQATATKLGIYSTHSPRNSLHFLARCSIFRKPLTKYQTLVRLTRSPRQQRPARWTKNGYLSIAFSVQGTGGSPTVPNPENRVGNQDIGSPGRLISSKCEVPSELGHFPTRTRHSWRNSRGFFLSKCSSIATAEMSNTQH